MFYTSARGLDAYFLLGSLVKPSLRGHEKTNKLTEGMGCQL